MSTAYQKAWTQLLDALDVAEGVELVRHECNAAVDEDGCAELCLHSDLDTEGSAGGYTRDEDEREAAKCAAVVAAHGWEVVDDLGAAWSGYSAWTPIDGDIRSMKVRWRG